MLVVHLTDFENHATFILELHERAKRKLRTVRNEWVGIAPARITTLTIGNKTMAKKMEFHKYCLLFPKADDKTLHEMADDIVENGLKDDIVTYEDKILDGRNRYFACEIAKVEPVYVRFEDMDGDDPLQYVISKNLHRRHLQESQRATVAHDVYEMQKKVGVPGATLDTVAEQFNVSKTTVKEAGKVKKSASESAQQAVREGTTRLSAASNAIKQAVKEMGITKPTTPEEKKQIADATDRILKDEAPPEKPTAPKKSPGQEFNEAVLSGEYNGKMFRANIKEMQACISTLERMPALYNSCFDLLGTLDQESHLNNMIGVLVEAVKRVKARVQRNYKPDFSEVKKVVADMIANHFPDMEDDFGASGKRELTESVKNKIISDCDEYVEEAERIRKQFRTKHDV